MPAEPSDHELLLQLKWEFGQVRLQLAEVLGQLSRGNARFEQIALKEQEVSIGMTSLRSDFSRAMLSSGHASKDASTAMTLSKNVLDDLSSHLEDDRDRDRSLREVQKQLSDVRSEVEKWKNTLKVVGVIFVPIQTVIVAIIIEIVRRNLTP